MIDRFVLQPTDTVQKRLAKETKELKGEIDGLGKKLHYLETTHRNSRDHMDRILGTGR